MLTFEVSAETVTLGDPCSEPVAHIPIAPASNGGADIFLSVTLGLMPLIHCRNVRPASTTYF